MPLQRRNLLEVPANELTEQDIIYDWNVVSEPMRRRPTVMLFDETLRDGLQSPSIVDPPIEEKLRIVHLMDELGIEYADISLPGAGPRAVLDTKMIVKEIRDARLRIKPACAARTMTVDIQPIIDVSQELGVPIEVMTFIGSSSIRHYAETWNLDRMLSLSAEAITLARRYNLPCCYVTEDTTRAHPDVLRALFVNAIEQGANRLCLCDTVGHATPDGVRALVQWTQSLLKERGVADRVQLDWHGHNDRGLALENALWAAEFGVDRIHGTALGIGERVGNAALDQILLNMRLLGWIDRDLSKLVLYGKTVANATRMPVPVNYPLIGDDAFKTATGVHAAAILKAQRRGDTFLADRIYSAVPAALFGRRQEIAIGPMSGESNVLYWLEQHHIPSNNDVVQKILSEAKSSNRLLTDDELMQVIHDDTTK